MVNRAPAPRDAQVLGVVLGRGRGIDEHEAAGVRRAAGRGQAEAAGGHGALAMHLDGVLRVLEAFGFDVVLAARELTVRCVTSRCAARAIARG